MRCTSPRTVGFLADGKTLSWSQKNYSKEFATFQLPCGKCIACRLEYSRQWAIRCVHEAQMHEENCFITLTYSDENLISNKLQYEDFQLFMKRLRKAFPNRQIGMFVTGEYGDQTKRPHWHAIIFNWRPSDASLKYINDRKDKVYSSELLTKLWGKGIAEFGSVTFESAGYCARYAAKKLQHGNDADHDFHPISKKSSKHAIGKKWLEKYWPEVFDTGSVFVMKSDGSVMSSPIPRYYEKWLQKHQPERWKQYVIDQKALKIQKIEENNRLDETRRAVINYSRLYKGPQISSNEQRKKILKQKFKQLQTYLKLK